MGRGLRIAAVTCVTLFVLVGFQALQAKADKPNTGVMELNHATGGTATGSGSYGTNLPSNAIDGSTATFWESSSTTGWLAVRFALRGTIDEVHVHFAGTTKYPKLSLYVDEDGDANQVYERKAWSTTGNGELNVKIPLAATTTYGVKVTIDAKVGSTRPKIAELDAYLRFDTDGDGLTNTVEANTIYYQDMAAGGLPLQIPDDEVNAASSAVSLVPFHGPGVAAFANFTVDHRRMTDLTATVGYWNGSGWLDRYVWDPGKRLLSVGIIQPAAGSHVDGTVTVTAYVEQLDITESVEFRIDGVLKATNRTPSGNEYGWTWDTSPYAEEIGRR